ncbi:hypothetical protein LO762_00165 [Actinocorallia sp. API 0066]|uniref:hypothetical protein n=1 Tax=Actinocorallia sp. API 0066 TaxID=2896846 RepID=UPI001E3BB41E|nr:hypothetical protein [Actinocorallia sp. API 0066]MCD0447616.1 hypothetical protein [Actinocorallia sp. API 0066]
MFSGRKTDRLVREVRELARVLEEVRRSGKKQEDLLSIVDGRSSLVFDALTLQNPGSTVAAEAYDGLRKQIVAAMSERAQHLVQLVQLDAALARGVDAEGLRPLVGEWIEQARLVRIDDPAHPRAAELFTALDEGDGPVEVVTPAYVDGNTDRVVRAGEVRHVPATAPEDTVEGPQDVEEART